LEHRISAQDAARTLEENGGGNEQTTYVGLYGYLLLARPIAQTR
jgi:hypothetical protein